MRHVSLLFPALVAVLLSLPCLGYTFLWDDFNFLANALSGNLRDWLPRSDDPFYRPISRALYFGIVAPFGTGGALLAHLMNLAYLAIAVTCLTMLATRIRTQSFGLVVGALFAGMSAVPTLVGWASCSQDLLAIDFVLLALLARSSGRGGLAIVAFTAALLSKETALTAIPALVAWDWIVERRPYRLKHHAAYYSVVVVAWAAIHPAARVLLARGLAPGATGYVGLTEPRTWLLFAARYSSVLTNLRLGHFEPTWSAVSGIYLGLVVLGSILGLMTLTASSSRGPANSDVSVRRIVILGILLTVPALIMTSTIINSWAPYYAAFPMLGLSLLGALALERVRWRGRMAIIGLYFALGIWARGSNLDSLHVTERELRPSSDALKKIETGFRIAAPRLPPHTDILLSTQVRGISRVYVQMYVFQPPRLWYRDLTMHVLKPTHVHPSDRPTSLALITSDLDVVFLNPLTLEFQSASGRPPDYHSAEKALRGLAVGLGGAGFPDRGTNILLRIPNPTNDLLSAHIRVAAMLQLAGGRQARADSLIAMAPPLSRRTTLDDLHVILAEQPPGVIWDDFALRVYGIHPDDTDALRELAGWLASFRYAEQARRMATRLLALQPRDAVGLRAMEVADSILVERQKWPEELL